MPKPFIALINASTKIKDDDIASMVGAFQTQVTRDLAPAWSLQGADIAFFYTGRGGRVPAGAWWLVFLDDSDQANALGYHEMTEEGLPIGKVFVAADLQYGQKVSVTASHELLEMLCDPEINVVKDAVYQGKDVKVAIEICDPVEADNYSYNIDGISVSDFVLPNFYEPQGAQSSVYDHLGWAHAPMTLTDGGYLSIDDGSGWTQVMGRRVLLPHLTIPVIGSRRHRRMTDRSFWRSSTAHHVSL